jgi:hypothetical protein
MQKLTALLVLFLSMAVTGLSQQFAYIKGRITNERGRGIEAVTVAVSGTGIGTSTDRKGNYELQVPANTTITIAFTFVGYETQTQSLTMVPGQSKVMDVQLKEATKELDEVIKTADRSEEAGNIKLDVSKAGLIPTVGFGSGVEALIKTYVGSNNEMTSQYNVRGGNYDENLVYVNDFEIYRPFLTRSGQQEGMSFVNADLVSGVNFSIGGFQSKYGDKMSSVLDVTYKNPTEFGGRAMLSALGASLALEGASKNGKLTWLAGARQKSNQYLLQAQPTQGVYNPSFTDVQADIKYHLTPKWEVELIGNYARNRFSFMPEEQTSSFGLINKAFQLRVFYDGQEIDQFDSRFGGISTTFKPNKKLRLKFLASGFQTNEKETYDILGEYLLGELETDLGKENFGQLKTYLGTGIIHTYARNYLQVNVGDVGHRGSYDGGKHFIQWGLGGNITSISDKLNEWERRDSAGFTQPFDPNTLELTRVYTSSSEFNYIRYTGYLQDNFRIGDSIDLTGSIGARFNYSTLNGELLISPRAHMAYKPEWKRDIVFKIAGGLYQQPPFYREMRDLNGNVNKSLKAQKSFHILLGSDYNFKSWGRPFKLTTEVYYKGLWDIVPYEYDNVRIRYFGKNNAIGRIYGGEMRIYGDIVKDATSWISIGIMKAEEDITDDIITYKNTAGADSASVEPGYVPRPADQRFMLGMYFEDYLPRNKNFKMHLNLMYSTGLPFGPPDQKRYGDTLRLPQYIRVDIGFSALLLDGSKHSDKKLLGSFKKIWFSAEAFNLLGIQNTLSYTWIQDQSSGLTFAVPNRLTSRLINAKLIIDF